MDEALTLVERRKRCLSTDVTPERLEEGRWLDALEELLTSLEAKIDERMAASVMRQERKAPGAHRPPGG